MATTSESGFARVPDELRLVTGGTVQAQDGLYLRRAADARLLELCRSGAFAYILTSRQMGKSSLLVETARTLAHYAVRAVMIDLTGLGTDATREQWYREILREIGDQLDLKTNVPAWWRQQGEDLSIAQRFSRFLEEVALRETEEHIVIFVDEIDTTLRMDFTDDFFVAIRYFYNGRAANPDLNRLSFVLTGVAAPGDLIKDEARTPFNIGERVELTDFTFEESRPLSQGLGLADGTLRRVLEWTGGHPYLTLRVFRSFQEDPLPALTDDAIDRRVAELFLGERSREDSNLSFVRGMLAPKLRAEEAGNRSNKQELRTKAGREKVLLLYRDIRKGKAVVDEELDSAKSWLKLSGVVKRDGGQLRIRNRIYAEVFTAAWANGNLEVNWPRRLAQVGAGMLAFLMICAIPLAVYAWKKKGDADIEAATARREASIARRLEVEAKAARSEAERQSAIATVQRDRAEQLENTSLARGLLGYSAFLLNTSGDPELAALLAIESLQRDPAPDGAQALRNASFYLRKRVTLADRSNTALAMDFSPDGSRVLLAGDAGGLYSLPSGALIRKLSADQAAFTGDGKGIRGIDHNGIAHVWDAGTGAELRHFQFPSGATETAISPDGRLAAAAIAPKTFRIWNLETGAEIAALTGGEYHSPVFSPDGQWLAVEEGGLASRVRLWRSPSPTFEELHLPYAGGNVYGSQTVFSHDSRQAVVFGRDGIFVFQLGTAIRNTSRFAFRALSAGFDSNGTRLIAGGNSGEVAVWDLLSGAETLRFNTGAAVQSVTFSPDGRLIATGGTDNATRIWDAISGREIGRFLHAQPVYSVHFSPDGRLLAALSAQSPVRIINIHEAGVLLAPPPISGTSFSADGRRLALVTDRSSYVLNWKNGMYDEEGVSPAVPAELIALSADGKRLASAHHYGATLQFADGVNCEVVDLDKGGKLANFQLSGTPTALGFAIGGNKILAAILGRNLEVVDPATGKAEDTRISDYVLAISSDGRRVLTRARGSDSKVAVAEISSGAKTGSFDSGLQLATGTMSGDGRVVAVVDVDGKAQVWDLKELGEPVRISDPSPISAVGLNSDGSLLLTASQDQVQVRPWKVADLIKQACQMLTRPMTPEEWELYLREIPYHNTCAAQAGGKSK